MKKFTRIALIGVAATTLFAFSSPQGDSFEGIVTYSMNIGGDANAQAAAMMQGSSKKDYIKGDKVRSEVSTGMYKSITIIDRKTKEEVTLVDMMGNKYEVKPDPNKPKPEDKQPPEIKYVDSTKQIAGYTCKAAEITVVNPRTSEKSTFTVYYTDQLPYSTDMGQYKGLKGFPLQYGIKQQGMNIMISATSVEKKALSDTLFAIPAKGYKVVGSREEMMKDIQQDMGGGGGQQ
jgi:GLPGLI family protein